MGIRQEGSGTRMAGGHRLVVCSKETQHWLGWCLERREEKRRREEEGENIRREVVRAGVTHRLLVLIGGVVALGVDVV